VGFLGWMFGILTWGNGMGDRQEHTFRRCNYRDVTGIINGGHRWIKVLVLRLLFTYFLGSGTVHRVPGTHMGFSLIHLLGCSRGWPITGAQSIYSLACAIVGMKECFPVQLVKR